MGVALGLTKRRSTVVASVALAASVAGGVVAAERGLQDGRSGQTPEGRDEREPLARLPKIEAAFAAESYHPGATAVLVSFDTARNLTVTLFRVGDARGIVQPATMRGTQIGPSRHFPAVSPGRRITVPLAHGLESGLYFARLDAAAGRAGYAPFVVAPKQLGEHRIAVVLPTQTWQAYNFRDDDGDGDSDTWYASPQIHTARLLRPFENRGVPPHYRYYDDPFLRWVDHNRCPVDFLSDAELDTTTGAALRRAYRLLIFEGHHEYVTAHEYNAVTDYRDRGGNLMFLSANNFFYKITTDRNVMTRVGKWRDFGRPEAALVGVQYFDWDKDSRGGRPWRIANSSAGRWIFAGTGLRPGNALSSGGIEVDATAAVSPTTTQVIAEIPHPFGEAQNAQMTYYETTTGAHVFAAGAFSLATAVWQPPVSRMIENLIGRLGGASASVVPVRATTAG